MGTFHYGTAGQCFEIADGELVHLQAVIVAKLRRREPFLLSFVGDEHRDALWIHESCTLRSTYAADASRDLDRGRLEEMVRSTNQPGGLTLRIGAVVADDAPVVP